MPEVTRVGQPTAGKKVKKKFKKNVKKVVLNKKVNKVKV